MKLTGFLFLAVALTSLAAQAPIRDWQGFLTRYVDTSHADGVNRVRYAAVTPADKAALEAWLKGQQAAKPSALQPKARLAYWVNLYNAQTAASVLAAWPVKSILDIQSPGSSAQGPWKAKLLEVEGRPLSLDDVENAILRPAFKDPRIHFALNCASLGCPELAPQAFTAANADGLMDRAARAFLDSPHGVGPAGAKGQPLRLSSLFDWYKGDFGKTDREVLDRLAGMAGPATAARLRSHSGPLQYHYDWSLNAAP